MWMAFTYGILYLIFATISMLYGNVYGWSVIGQGLSYLGKLLFTFLPKFS